MQLRVNQSRELLIDVCKSLVTVALKQNQLWLHLLDGRSEAERDLGLVSDVLGDLNQLLRRLLQGILDFEVSLRAWSVRTSRSRLSLHKTLDLGLRLDHEMRHGV